jgi:hypothetical protein
MKPKRLTMNPPTSSIALPADALRLALAGLGRVLSRTITLPALATVRVIRHRGTITLAATDLDLHLCYTHRTEHPPLTDLARALAEMRWAREPAEGICVPSAALRGAAKATGDILIAADKLTFSTVTGETTLPFEGIAVAEFPWLEDEHYSPVCSFDALSRTALLDAVHFGSTDETRFVLNGVHLESHASDGKPAEPVVVATDGRRLYKHPLPAITDLPENVILPHATLHVLGAPALRDCDWIFMFTKGKETVRPPCDSRLADYAKALAAWNAATPAARKLVEKPKKPASEKIPATPRARIHAGPWELTSKIIEGIFPNWRQVMPHFADPITVSFTPAQAGQFRTILAQWPKVKVDNDAITLAFPGTGMRLSDKNGTLHLLPGVHSTQPIGITVNRKYLADAMTLGTPVLRLFSEGDPLDFMIGAARVIVMPLKGDHVHVEDSAKSAAEAEWLGCTVRLPDEHEGEVLAISRNGSKLVATVSDPPRAAIQRVPLETLKLLSRPVAAAA